MIEQEKTTMGSPETVEKDSVCDTMNKEERKEARPQDGRA
jgi:hypothetical protein